jgi:hypothetical protein
MPRHRKESRIFYDASIFSLIFPIANSEYDSGLHLWLVVSLPLSYFASWLTTIFPRSCFLGYHCKLRPANRSPQFYESRTVEVLVDTVISPRSNGVAG